MIKPKNKSSNNWWKKNRLEIIEKEEQLFVKSRIIYF
jgi:hypothetical protein